MSNDRINTAFEEIGEALKNPKLKEGFLNGNKEDEIMNELAERFDKQAMMEKFNNLIPHARVRVNQKPNKIPHISA